MKSSICLLALLISLTGCDGGSNRHDPASAQDDDSIGYINGQEQIDDALTAPVQPTLLIDAARAMLVFSYLSDQDYPVGNLYEFDTVTRSETLIQDNITAQADILPLPSRTPLRPWHTQQFRLELCDATDCVSSDRVAINTLVADTAHTLRPSVFLKGERFAESVTANFDASMVASTLPIEGAVQIHFYNQTQWIATEPVRLTLTNSQALLDISSSHTGDMLAVLIKDNEAITQSGSVRIVERLGEAWIPTGDIPLPAGITLDADSIISVSPDAGYLYLHTPAALSIYQRNNLDWSLRSSLTAPLEETIAATSVNAQSDQIYALLRQSDGPWLVAYQLVEAQNGLTWREKHRQRLTGVDKNDELFLQRDADDSSILVAGWDGAILGERSPVLWRFNVIATDGEVSGLTVSHSLRTRPTQNGDAELRFSASENLDTAALGWHSPSGDDAQLSTYTFNEQEQRYRVALELPHALATLAKQNFGHDVFLSRDGTTLLVSTLPGNATPSSNRAGELLIFR